MKRLIGAVLLSLFGLFGSASFAAEVSEATVKRLMAEVDQAIPARDVSVIEKLLADEVAIALIVNVDGDVKRIQMTKPEYLAMVRQAWAVASVYTYKRSNQKIAIQDRKALVTADVTESITASGRTVVTRSQEMAVIEDVGGTLQATAIRVVSLAEPATTSGTLL